MRDPPSPARETDGRGGAGRAMRRLAGIARAARAALAAGSIGAVVVLGALGAGTAGCGEPAPPRPNVLLIVLDTLRTDHLSAYGYPLPTSPNLEALAARGARFLDCTSQAAWTGPSMVSLMTGLPIFNSLMILPVEYPVLAQEFQRAGYHTGGVSANSVLSADHGFSRGYDSFAAREVTTGAWTADDVNRHAQGFLDGLDGRPFLLWLHYLDTHDPYTPPERPWTRKPEEIFTPWEQQTIARTIQAAPEAERGALATQVGTLADEVDRYDAELHYLDSRLGALFADLERRGLMENTYVVVASDHGETLFRRLEHPDRLENTRTWKTEHGQPMELRDYMKREHHSYVYQELVRTPLIVAGPGIRPGQTPESLVANLDILPTLLGLTGLPPLARDESTGSRGRDLSSFLRHGEAVPPAPWVTSTAYETVSARLPDGRKVVLPGEAMARRFGMQPHVFSLRTDPNELTPAPPTAEEKAVLDQLRSAWAQDPFTRWIGSDQTPKDIEALRELGYVR